jgi:hypothetical protein
MSYPHSEVPAILVTTMTCALRNCQNRNPVLAARSSMSGGHPCQRTVGFTGSWRNLLLLFQRA